MELRAGETFPELERHRFVVVTVDILQPLWSFSYALRSDFELREMLMLDASRAQHLILGDWSEEQHVVPRDLANGRLRPMDVQECEPTRHSGN